VVEYGEAPLPVLVTLAPRPPAVAKLEVDARRKSAPKEEAAEPKGKAKFGAKEKAVSVVCVAPVLPAVCRFDRHWPVLPPPLEPTGLLPHQFPVPRVVRAAPFPVVANGVPPGSISRRAPSRSSPACNQKKTCTSCRGECVCLPPVDHVFVTTVYQLGVVSLWLHGPAGFEELHGMFANLGEFLKFWCMMGQVRPQLRALPVPNRKSDLLCGAGILAEVVCVTCVPYLESFRSWPLAALPSHCYILWVQRVIVFSDSACSSTDHVRTILVKLARLWLALTMTIMLKNQADCSVDF